MTVPRRKLEITRLREEGRRAALAGKNRQAVPYRTSSPDWFQWLQGFNDGERDLEEENQWWVERKTSGVRERFAGPFETEDRAEIEMRLTRLETKSSIDLYIKKGS